MLATRKRSQRSRQGQDCNACNKDKIATLATMTDRYDNPQQTQKIESTMSGGGFFNHFLGGTTGNTGQQCQGDGGRPTKGILGGVACLGNTILLRTGMNEVPQGGYAQRTNNNNSNNIIDDGKGATGNKVFCYLIA